MKAVWRENKDGYIFVYAIDNKQTFLDVIDEIKAIKENDVYKNVSLLRLKLRCRLLLLPISLI